VRRRALLVTAIVLVVAGAGVAAYAFVSADGTHAPAASGLAALGRPTASTTSSTSTSTTTLPPTTTTILPVAQPAPVVLPPLPFGALRIGSRGDVVRAYEQRLKDLHFDPGPVDGSFDQDTRYAVVTVDKYLGLPRDGVITPMVQQGLQNWHWTPALPKAEGDRVEIDLDRQVLTLFRKWQPVLVTTTSTGSGEHFCGGTDGCQYAITPTGHFHFNYLHRGWDNGKLGKMWNPYYFNGGIAVHGLQSVPTYPASHGCARIPMHIADYFYTLVYRGMSIYVVGAAKKPGNLYVGPTVAPPPAPTAPPTSPPPPAPPSAPPTTKKPVPPPPTTKPTTPTTKPTPPTTKKPTPTT
jgi:L,D-transpeptidase catalytic domain/Putative peptidoglycan binding domain